MTFLEMKQANITYSNHISFSTISSSLATGRVEETTISKFPKIKQQGQWYYWPCSADSEYVKIFEIHQPIQKIQPFQSSCFALYIVKMSLHLSANAVEQWLERRPGVQVILGSIPGWNFLFFSFFFLD